MPQHPITIFTLPTGLRCMHYRLSGATECCGLIIDAGSRDESASDAGLAHFVEHTIFKGTQRRKSWHIINRMEAVGGELNAYTTKEHTAIYTIAPRGNAARSIELIADLVSSSTFPETELNKEREVVADEIDSYLDIPADAIWDDFDELIFAHNPLAHNILGTKHTVARFDSADCSRWLHEHYGANRMAFFYCGAANPRRIQALVERYFAHYTRITTPTPRLAPQPIEPFRHHKSIESHQAHTMMGRIIDGLYAPNRHALALLTNILGGPGMNSLLNVALRERHGLVYNVEATATRYTDCGTLNIYFGCDHHDVERCIDITSQILHRLRTQPLTKRQFLQAKRQYLGQMAIASDSRESLALAMGRNLLYYNNVYTTSESQALIRNLTLDDIMACLDTFDPSRFSILTLS